MSVEVERKKARELVESDDTTGLIKFINRCIQSRISLSSSEGMTPKEMRLITYNAYIDFRTSVPECAEYVQPIIDNFPPEARIESS